MERDAGRELAVERRGVAAPPQRRALVSHWDWRPEWAEDRPCWFWYLTFDAQSIEEAVGHHGLESVRAKPWLDAVPSPWLHLTVSEAGYADELAEPVVAEIRARVDAVAASEGRPLLRLGPVHAMRSAVVLPVDGGDQLRRLQQRVREVTAGVLGRDVSTLHPQPFWPHVSLGYANCQVASSEVDALLAGMSSISAAVRPAELALVAVTRKGGHYQWSGRRHRSTVGPAADVPRARSWQNGSRVSS